jgi:hypothetical protein
LIETAPASKTGSADRAEPFKWEREFSAGNVVTVPQRRLAFNWLKGQSPSMIFYVLHRTKVRYAIAASSFQRQSKCV